MDYTPTPWGPTVEVTSARLLNIENTLDQAVDAIEALKKVGADKATSGITLSATPAPVTEIDSASPVTVLLPGDAAEGAYTEIYAAGAGAVTVAGAAGVDVQVAAPFTGKTTPMPRGSVHVRCRGGQVAAAPPATNLGFRVRAGSVSGAEGSAVTSVAESSGQGHPALACTNVALTLDSMGTGIKGLVFNGSSSTMALSGSALDLARNRGALTVFAAIGLPNAVTTGVRTLFALSTGASATASRVLLGHRESSGGLVVAGGRQLDANSGQFVTGTALTTVQKVVLAARFRWTSRGLVLTQGGVQVGASSTFQAAGSTSDTRSLAGAIGSNAGGTGEWAQLHLYELLGYWDDDASGDLQKAVDSYFLAAHGTPSIDGVTSVWLISGGVPA